MSIFVCLLAGVVPAWAQQFDVLGPAGSVAFGSAVAVLPSGEFLVADPNATIGAVADAGAVYVYSPSGSLIRTISGSSANDQVGSGGFAVLANGNFVISSPNWSNGSVAAVGAVTWVSGAASTSETVSQANSLIGSSANDHVGAGSVHALPNGNYVVVSYGWANGTAVQAGAVTWANGASGLVGAVSSSNSLVGSTSNDGVGNYSVYVMPSSNYVVISSEWSNAGAAGAGAVTWGSGDAGIHGTISNANSLVGTAANDRVGIDGATILANGNYVVRSSVWNAGAATSAGAVTWGNGATGTSGNVSAANSLVGSSANDSVGNFGAIALTNGNYVISSPNWSNGSIADAGAATWGNGATGISGAINSSNSLVGIVANDMISFGDITPLPNGGYVVDTFTWANGTNAKAGAITWASSTGLTGTVSTSNSLVGTGANDSVGFYGVTALSNGNYVVGSPLWNNGSTARVGAVTCVVGGARFSGVVSTTNSLTGTQAGDEVGYGVVQPLASGRYVVASPYWANGSAAKAGAATWMNSCGSADTVSSANSLVGSTANDEIGAQSIALLADGNYLVSSPNWSNGAVAKAGAVTWANGSLGLSGAVSAANSLVGSTANDQVGVADDFYPVSQSNGNYVVQSPYWANSGLANAGALSLGRGSRGLVGPILPGNSVLGGVANGGLSMTFAYDDSHDVLIVGQPASNVVSLFNADAIFANGFE
jgi:Repeat of unknown function (DUF5650)